MEHDPQSLQWTHDQIIIRSGILKFDGKSSYHPYLSKACKHDQQFIQIPLEEMLFEVEYNNKEITIVNESDNYCSSTSLKHIFNIYKIY